MVEIPWSKEGGNMTPLLNEVQEIHGWNMIPTNGIVTRTKKVIMELDPIEIFI
jgi:hypothetical protein